MTAPIADRIIRPTADADQLIRESIMLAQMRGHTGAFEYNTDGTSKSNFETGRGLPPQPYVLHP